MGGTPPFSMPAGRVGWSRFFLVFLGRELAGRGDATLGGGVATLCGCTSGAGGVGSGGAGGATLDCSEVFECVLEGGSRG